MVQASRLRSRCEQAGRLHHNDAIAKLVFAASPIAPFGRNQ